MTQLFQHRKKNIEFSNDIFPIYRKKNLRAKKVLIIQLAPGRRSI